MNKEEILQELEIEIQKIEEEILQELEIEIQKIEEKFYKELVEPLKGRDMHNRPPLYDTPDEKIEEIN